jgi:hypothetical protein
MNLAGFQRRGFCFVHLAAVGLLSVAALALCGCETVAGSKAVTLVRVIDASYNAPALDAYVSGTLIAVNFAAPSIGNYAFVPPGEATVSVDPTGKHTATASVTGSLLASEQHTLYITDSSTGYQATLLTDQNTPGPDSAVSIRFLQQAVSTGAVDVYLVPDGTKITDAKPLLTDLAPGTITAYLNIPAGTYDVVVAATGTTTGAYTSAATALVGGQVRTMLIVDSQLLSTPPVNVIVGDDLN